MEEEFSQKTPASRIFVLIVFIILIGILGFLAGFYFTGKNISELNLTANKITVTVSPTPQTTIGMQVYNNKNNGFSIMYPNNYSYRDYPDGGGVGFRPTDLTNDSANEVINILFNDIPATSQDLSLEGYAKVAATGEIQNYQSLATINKVTTDSGTLGYETTWNVTGASGSTSVSLPITYFSPSGSARIYEIFLNNNEYLSTYNQMINTFSFTSGN